MVPVIVLFAPTACGKTALAREFFGRSSLSCFKGRGEVISADSQAVYTDMDVGTAKPSAEECADIPHHLINIISPKMQFGVGEFISLADDACRKIWERGNLPLVVGGTGFYIRNFLLGLPVTPESDPAVRQNIRRRLQEEGNDALYRELCKVDAVSAARINVHDAYRIARALEVYYTSGKPLSSFALPQRLREGYQFCTVILTREKEDLYRRIDERVEQMFAHGLADEVGRLISSGITEDDPGMKAIGYREFFLKGLSLGEIKEKIKLDSRHYAKKQYTFMRDIPGAVTIDADDRDRFLEIVTAFSRLMPV